MSPLQLRRRAWTLEWQQLSVKLDAMESLSAALAYLWEYHELTGFVDEYPPDLQPYRMWRADRKLSLLAYDIPRRGLRYQGRKRKSHAGCAAPAHGGHPLATENIFEQQAGRQFPYLKSINGSGKDFLAQVQPFGREHFTIASAAQEPQDWRPSQTRLHRLILDMHALALMLGRLVLYNGLGAGAGIRDWLHVHSLCEPDDGPLPVRQACGLAGPAAGPVIRIDEPLWPLPAFRIAGTAGAIAGEVLKLAARSVEVAGADATESIALYPEDGAATCIFTPRDRRRELAREFGGNLGAFETATGSLVFSDPVSGAALREGRIGFDELWRMLREARPEWSDEL